MGESFSPHFLTRSAPDLLIGPPHAHGFIQHSVDQGIEHFLCISAQPEYRDRQVEEIRLEYYLRQPPMKSSSGDMQWGGFLTPQETFGGMFTGDTFAVKVGSGSAQKIYHVHESALRKCPPFAAAIDPGKWRASHTRQLDLSDDDPQIFVILLEFLYTGDFSPKFRVFNGDRTLNLLSSQRQDAAFNITQLYCLADKYFIDNIKPLIIEKLNLCEITPQNFLELASLAYDQLPDLDQHCAFKFWARSYIKQNKERLTQCIEMQAVVEKGGPLAWDIFRTSFILRVIG